MTIAQTEAVFQLSPLDDFAATLRASDDPVAEITAGLIGKNAVIPGPDGPQKLVYADYVASGRAIRQVEDFIQEQVLPFYANSHTEASYCGGYMTRMRERARDLIAGFCGANRRDHAVIFAGSGATAGLNRLVHLLGIPQALARNEMPHVLVGPYEHHSNLLPWRESGARVIEIAEAAEGGPDLGHVAQVLAEIAGQGPIIGSFSAAANVTGVCTDLAPVARLIKAAGGKFVADYAGGAPYLTIDMTPGGVPIDAVALSPHKFIGGPGASGLLILRRDAAMTKTPSTPGGGTVAFVNPRRHDYVDRIEAREEGGTPNIVGDIRACLCLIVKDVIGQDYITRRNRNLIERAFAALGDHPNIQLLASDRQERLPILSFVVRDCDGARVNYQQFTKMLSARYGIQARGGCSCAGPYVHRLLHIDDAWSEQIRCDILNGQEDSKPGFVRLNLSYLMADATVDFILSSVCELAENMGNHQT